MFFNNKFNTFFGLNLILVYTFPMCMAWRFHFTIRKYDFKITLRALGIIEDHTVWYWNHWRRSAMHLLSKTTNILEMTEDFGYAREQITRSTNDDSPLLKAMD